MIYETFLEQFNRALFSIFPDRKEVVDFISHNLHIDKRAAYRRLLGDYQFRINEIIELCSLLNISLDKIISRKQSAYTPPSFVYYLFGKLTEKEFKSIDEWLDKFKIASKEKDSYILLSSNILPEIFCFQLEHLVRFYKLKWSYYMDELCTNFMESESVLQPAHIKAIREYIETIFQFEKLLIIWDYNIIPALIKDIDYFTSIGYLTSKHRTILKEELFLLIDKIDILCKECSTPQQVSRFTFAVSSTYLKKTHSIVKGKDFKIAVDSAFYTTYLYVSDPRIVESVEHIVLSTLKSSVIISQSNETERIKFIAEQRRLVEDI